MIKIKEVVEKMDDTLNEAEWYIDNAIVNKELHPGLSQAYYQLADEHLNHYNKLHGAIITLINEYRREKGEPPEKMTIIWEYIHKCKTEEYNKIKEKLSCY